MPKLKNPVAWFEIYVSDMARAKSFYERVFERTLTPEITDGSFEALKFAGGMPDAGAMGALMKHPMRKPSTEGTIVYFECDDCSVESERAIQNGGQLFKPKWSIGKDGFIAIIGDTEGNAIGLHSFK